MSKKKKKAPVLDGSVVAKSGIVFGGASNSAMSTDVLRLNTHWEGCSVEGGPRHYECAVAEITRLRSRVVELENECHDWRSGKTFVLTASLPKPQEQNQVPGYEAVDHPDHYNAHPSGVEAIIIVQEFPFSIGSALKYIWRAGLKPGVERSEDLSKTLRYLEFEIERIQTTGAQEGALWPAHPSGIRMMDVAVHMPYALGVAFREIWRASTVPASARHAHYRAAMNHLRSEIARHAPPMISGETSS